MKTGQIQGLTSAQVAEKTAAGLHNRVDAQAGRSERQIVLSHIFTFFNLIFVVLAVVLVLASASVKHMGFLVVAVCNAAIGIFQEVRAKRAVDKLSLMVAQQVLTLRDGNLLPVRSDLLVQDDVVEFAAGDQICADAVVLGGQIYANEALLTGEEDPIVKNAGDTLLSGSFVIAGTCRARLTQVGNHSFAAKLTREAKADPRAAKSEMMGSLDKLVQVMGLLLIPMGIATFCHQYWGLQIAGSSAAQTTVAALVGMIPEGLYLLTSVALAASALLLSTKRVLVQDMNCIETLARVDVLCVDKTGTITQPEMKVKTLVTLENTPKAEIVAALGALYAGRPADNDTAQAVAQTYQDAPQWVCEAFIPFTSQTKWCAGVFDKGSYIAGAPDCILGSRYGEISAQVEQFNAQGNRVLLLARYTGDLRQDLADSQVRPMALVVLENPVRPQAVQTFAYFKEQGVTIKVISGDNARTASAVAQAAGIPGAEHYVDARQLQDGDYDRAAEAYTVFGRVTPEQKKKLILALKRQGHTVAMTGDGVNDVLAMKQADCGIAMASGAQACNQVAQLVLLDSDFGAMPAIVGEGRRVINNIQRAASLFLVKNIMSVGLAILAIVMGFAYPFQPFHLTMISAMTIGVPGFFFAMEPNYARVKGRFLPTVLRRALPGGISNVIMVLVLQQLLAHQSIPAGDISTVCTLVLAVTGVLVLVQTGRPMNLFRAAVVGAMAIGLAGCFVLLPQLFDLTIVHPHTHPYLAVAAAGSAGVFFLLQGIFVGIDKLLKK